LNLSQAKEILLLYRPNTRDAEDPEIIQAMELARSDQELGQWFAQHQAFQTAMRAKFRELEVPEHLKAALLARQKVLRPSIPWRSPVWLAAAAIFVVLLGLTSFWLRPSVPDRFAHYRESMVSAAVRMYGMDVETNDMAQLRPFFARKGAPADYDVTKGLAKLPLKGGGLLRWRGNPVSMVCFDRAGTTLFLFVLKRSALRDPPPVSTSAAELAQVEGLQTASWSHGEDIYVLAGPQEPDFTSKYLTPP
jgi:hypothetical protein